MSKSPEERIDLSTLHYEGVTAPSPDAIRQARARAGLTQAAAAAIVNASWRTWARWEAGGAPMKAAFWELFLIKTKAARSPE